MLAYVGHVLGLLGLCWAYGASMLGLCWAYVASMLGLWRASLWCLGRTGVPKMKTAGHLENMCRCSSTSLLVVGPLLGLCWPMLGMCWAYWGYAGPMVLLC